MPDPLLLASTAGALAVGAFTGWFWAQRLNRVERERWQHLLQRAVDEARIDPLTRLRNRRAFDEQVAIQTAVAQRYGTPYAVVLIDIDDLKAINDSAGHHAGDVALQQLAKLLKNSSRAADLVMRLAGDEFALLLPHTELAGAVTAATRILEQLAGLRQETTTDGTATTELRASLGVAAYCPYEAAADLVKRADQALYRAKQLGGQRVCMHDGLELALHRSIDTSIR